MSDSPAPGPVPGHDRGEAGDKLEAAITRGARAKELLTNELLQEAFARLEADYILAWRQTPARDPDRAAGQHLPDLGQGRPSRGRDKQKGMTVRSLAKRWTDPTASPTAMLPPMV